jgi:hypothetical protein
MGKTMQKNRQTLRRSVYAKTDDHETSRRGPSSHHTLPGPERPLQHLAVKLTHYALEIENAYSEGAPGETINAI